MTAARRRPRRVRRTGCAAVKRHLLVTNDFPPKVGGIQNYLWELWTRLDPASYVVLTASSDDGAAAFDAAQAERGIHIERVPGAHPLLSDPSGARRSAQVRGGQRGRHGPARPRPPARSARPAPRRPLRRRPPRRGGRRARPDPGSRAALGRVLRGAELIVSAGGYPAAEGAARRAAASSPRS